MNIVIVGYGAMGERLVHRIGNIEGVSLVGVIDNQKNFGLSSFDELQTIPDVIIDFSHPSNLKSMIDYAVTNKVALMIATTGFSTPDNMEIKAASKLIPIVQTANTSLGVNIVLEVLQRITPALEEFDIEVIEKHHNQKIDAPSGTAKMLVSEIQSSSSKREVVHGREGLSKRTKNEIGVHAVRGGTIAGEHTVIYAGEDEIIEIKHTALSKEVFVTGALKAAMFLNGATPGLYSMKDVLFS